MAASTIPPLSGWPCGMPFGNTQEGSDRLRSAPITDPLSRGFWIPNRSPGPLVQRAGRDHPFPIFAGSPWRERDVARRVRHGFPAMPGKREKKRVIETSFIDNQEVTESKRPRMASVQGIRGGWGRFQGPGPGCGFPPLDGSRAKRAESGLDAWRPGCRGPMMMILFLFLQKQNLARLEKRRSGQTHSGCLRPGKSCYGCCKCSACAVSRASSTTCRRAAACSMLADL